MINKGVITYSRKYNSFFLFAFVDLGRIELPSKQKDTLSTCLSLPKA